MWKAEELMTACKKRKDSARPAVYPSRIAWLLISHGERSCVIRAIPTKWKSTDKPRAIEKVDTEPRPQGMFQEGVMRMNHIRVKGGTASRLRDPDGFSRNHTN